MSGLRVCADGHGEVCFDEGYSVRAKPCPACEQKDRADAAEKKADELESELGDARDEAEGLHEQISELERGAHS